MADTLEFAGTATPLGDNDIAEVAAKLGVEPAAIAAVCDIEAPRGGFLPDKRPVILFESHAFHTMTDGEYDESNPDVSTPQWVRNYGATGAHQYDRLAEAIELDREAALQSASWGRFQIMGSNYAVCADDVEDFVKLMMAGEREQLDAFAEYCVRNHLVAALKDHDWATFARGYNGPGYAENDYDTKLAAAYRRHAANSQENHLWLGSTGPAVVQLQKKLARSGHPNVKADGDFGPITQHALLAYEAQHHLSEGPILLETIA